MNEFIYLCTQNNKNLHLQIIKSFAILILNVSNPQTIYFIFSNNFINQIISNNYMQHDEDFVFYYINFLKSLSMKIDVTTIQFFLHKEYNNFPLLKFTLKFYNYPDPMIKNTVRTVVLQLLKRKYQILTLIHSETRASLHFLLNPTDHFLLPFHNLQTKRLNHKIQ